MINRCRRATRKVGKPRSKRDAMRCDALRCAAVRRAINDFTAGVLWFSQTSELCRPTGSLFALRKKFESESDERVGGRRGGAVAGWVVGGGLKLAIAWRPIGIGREGKKAENQQVREKAKRSIF